jgi:general secretion pathway protein G
MRSLSTKKSGFTLVEILIVVIILGILAAIVIPQFTNASTEARNNSMRSTVQSIRSQIELYKVQHSDLYPTTAATDAARADGDWSWDRLTSRTTPAGAILATGACGPYMQSIPANTLRSGATTVVMHDTDAAALAATAGAGEGYVFSRETGKFWAFGADLAVITD